MSPGIASPPSVSTIQRFIGDLLARPNGPMGFRFLLQPLMAVFLAVRAGTRDAHAGRPAYLWDMFSKPEHRRDLLKIGWKDVTRVYFLAIALDVIFQLIQFKWIYPFESFVVAFVLAVLPYILVRGPVNRITRLKQLETPSLLHSEEDAVVVDIDSSGRKSSTFDKSPEQQERRKQQKG